MNPVPRTSPGVVLRRTLCGLAALLQLFCASCGEAPRESPACPVVRLAQQQWLSSRLNNAVAYILLAERLGCPVEIADIDEYAQFPALANGTVHACLEVWPSGHRDDLRAYVREQGLVEDGGPLGPVGRIGWFVPSYVLQDHPRLATWEGLKDPAAAALFRSSRSGSKGQFLAGDPTWVQYDADIIRNLGLEFRVVSAGSEEALLAALDQAYRERQPLLFYFWTPHAIFVQYDLGEVALPPYTAECYARAPIGGVDCGYPPEALRKVFWSGLKEYSPQAHYLLRNFSYTNEDQISMMALVQFQGMTPEEAARHWVDANEAVWKAWLP
ncbi:MAG: ABC transporter substrate-binding protein [Thermodesulfobacteriota bacterium]